MEKPKNEFVIDLSLLCHYDKRNPDCTMDDEEIEAHKRRLIWKKKTCSCDNCFYGRTVLTEQLIWQEEKMFQLHDEWITYVVEHFLPEFSSISFRDYVKQVNNK
jgi:hypothetical protein